MTALTANVKHLYQRRGMWLVYIFLLPILIGGVVTLWKAEFNENMIGITLTLMPLLGVIFTSLMTDVLNKPVSFCLPGHQAIIRKISFFIGIILSVLVACLFIHYPSHGEISSPVMILTGFFTGLLLYWIGVYLGVRFLQASSFIWLWPLFMVMVQDKSVLPWLERFNWMLIGSGLASSVTMWVWLAQRERHRRICGIPYIGFFGAYNINRVQKFRQLRASQKIIKEQKWESAFESWILRRLSAGGGRVGVLIWRAVYTLVGPFLMSWKWASLLWILFAVWLCYWGFMSFMVSFCIGFSLAMVDLRIYANSVRELDRRQLYVSSLVRGMVLLLIALLTISVLIMLTQCIEPWMPVFDLRSKNISFVALSWADLVYPILLIPAGLIAQLFFYRFRRWMLPVLMGAAFGLIGAFAKASKIELSKEFGWLYLFAVCLLLWIGFACALRRVCRKYDLIKL